MKRWLFRLQYKYKNFGIENLMLYISITMLAMYLMWGMMGVDITNFMFIRGFILRGEVWRLITFIFMPPLSNNFFLVLLSLYVYYFLGNSLEQYWGKFYFTVYYLFGIIGAIAAGMLTGIGDNTYINTSLLLAFAQLFPDTEFRLFFFIPIKVKYIGYMTWAFYALNLLWALVSFQWASVASLLASLANFFLFFGPDFIDRIKENRRYAARRRQFKKDTRDFRDRF